ncbi:MAG: hypothetical protein EZS28_005369 [Streblomastix strix]|uniref:Uncharacterized protein n=1 Tax=Streblomastix strix TaxID=222440 RepID=A0A5J4WX56_9EUKA|nr:MAG: hypothetical protein EZS28_005369 [Streblomastix strix]
MELLRQNRELIWVGKIRKEGQPIASQPEQQSLQTQPKLTSEPKIMIEPPVTQATVTQVRKVLSPVESECLKDVEVSGDTNKHTDDNNNLCPLLYNPVINKGSVKLEILRVELLAGIGFADESVCYGRNEWPSKRDLDLIVYYRCSGGIQHFFEWIVGNSGFSDRSRIGMELNMESNPRSLTFFIDDKEQPNFIINIPNAVRIWCYIYLKGASFKITMFEFLSTPTARHGEGSHALEYGKERKN